MVRHESNPSFFRHVHIPPSHNGTERSLAGVQTAICDRGQRMMILGGFKQSSETVYEMSLLTSKMAMVRKGSDYAKIHVQ